MLKFQQSFERRVPNILWERDADFITTPLLLHTHHVRKIVFENIILSKFRSYLEMNGNQQSPIGEKKLFFKICLVFQ